VAAIIGCALAQDPSDPTRESCNGRWRYGSSVGSTDLVATGKEDWNGVRQACPEPFVIRDRAWPSALNLVGSDLAVKLRQPIPFKTDLQSWDTLNKLVIREAKANHREEIWVTISGKLNAIHIRADGQVTGGYGHLGIFPAEMVLERIQDMTIKATPTYDYSDYCVNRVSGTKGNSK
jgi:hypothetical protein